MGMTRRAQIAQHPTLARLTAEAATFTEGEVVQVILPRVSWVAMGRPVDLQVVVTPIPITSEEDRLAQAASSPDYWTEKNGGQ